MITTCARDNFTCARNNHVNVLVQFVYIWLRTGRTTLASCVEINKLVQEGRILKNDVGVLRISLMYIKLYHTTKNDHQNS